MKNLASVNFTKHHLIWLQSLKSIMMKLSTCGNKSDDLVIETSYVINKVFVVENFVSFYLVKIYQFESYFDLFKLVIYQTIYQLKLGIYIIA